MSTSEVSPETPLDKGQRAEAAIPTNVRVYLGLSGKTQKALGEALGITKSAMSMKMCGKVGWSVSDLVTTADFLGVTPSALMDDTILSKAEAGYAKSAEYGVFAEKPGALVGAAPLGSLSVPSTPTPRSRVESQVQLKVPWPVSCRSGSRPARVPRPAPRSMTGLGFPAGLKPMRHLEP